MTAKTTRLTSTTRWFGCWPCEGLLQSRRDPLVSRDIDIDPAIGWLYISSVELETNHIGLHQARRILLGYRQPADIADQLSLTLIVQLETLSLASRDITLLQLLVA